MSQPLNPNMHGPNLVPVNPNQMISGMATIPPGSMVPQMGSVPGPTMGPVVQQNVPMSNPPHQAASHVGSNAKQSQNQDSIARLKTLVPQLKKSLIVTSLLLILVLVELILPSRT